MVVECLVKYIKTHRQSDNSAIMKVSFDIEIDVSNAVEQKFLQFYQDNLCMMKSVILCGFLMVEQGVCSFFDEKYKNEMDSILKDRFDKTLHQKQNLEEELALLKVAYDERYTRLYELKLQAKDEEMRRMHDEIERTKNNQISQINGRCVQLENELHKFHQRMQEEVRSKVEERLHFEQRIQQEYRRQNDELKERCKFYETEYRNAISKSTDYAVSCIKDSKVCELESENTRLKTELQCFKSTNIYKGQQGEKLLRDIVANHFTNFEILDTSKSGGLSDVHVITDTGSCFVFESKNKSTISVQDVEKSYADIQLLSSHYGNKLKGYIFVSHRTRSIPKKGHLHIECKDNIYIAWIGVNENDTCLDVYVVTILKLFASLGNLSVHDEAKNFDTLTTILKEKLVMLVDNIKICSTLQESINSMAHSLNTMHNNNKELYDSILHVSGLTSETLCRGDKGDKGVSKRSLHLQCSRCNATFKRKCDLTQHLGKCVQMQNN
jgi:hypothetical protein